VSKLLHLDPFAAAIARKEREEREKAEAQGAQVPDVTSPAEPLIPVEAPKPTTSATPSSTRPSTSTRTGTRAPSPPSPRPTVAPERDFQKVANSISRQAIPSGIFTGKAKQLYDCLYALTRGSISPSMTVRIARSALMKQSGIGAKVTLEQNLRRLITSGLITMKTIGGIQGGNEYTVYLPEEAVPSTGPSTPPSTGTTHPSLPSGGEKLGALASLESRVPSIGPTVDTQDTSEIPKTSFKTNTKNDDDAALAKIIFEPFAAAVLEATGRELTGADKAGLASVAETLAAEFKRAAGHTAGINAPGAFFATHLRRRLLKKEETRRESPRQQAPDTVPTTLPAETIPLEEHVDIFAGLIRDGEYNLESLKLQFSGGFSADEWAQIESRIKSCLEGEDGQ
jgi:hypothetical protein